MPTSRSMMLPAVVSFIAVFMARADVTEQLRPEDAIHMLQRRAVMKPTVECDGSDCELRSSQTRLEVSTQAEGLLQKGVSNITEACVDDYDLGTVGKPWSDFQSCAAEQPYCNAHPTTLMRYCKKTCGVCQTCADGTCTIADDPHITVFDGKLISLVQAGERHRLARGKFDASSVHMLKRLISDGETGDMWLVKSGKVSIQARYVRDDTLPEDNLFVGAVAVGGEFMNGNKLIIGALDDNVTYNGNEILGAQESKFEVSGLIKAERHVQARLVQNTDSINPGIDVELPEGVKLLINRQGHYINVQIKMPPAEGGQDGFCGNFNGNGDDDSLEFIEARNPRVAESDSLFA